MNSRPSSIIRTLPVFYADIEHEAGHAHYHALRQMERDHAIELYLALSSRPKAKIEHVYILTANRVRVRLHLARFEDGDARECFDGSIRKAGAWAICTGPVSRAPREIIRRGFQGFRYTEDLW